jgi:hypothetical protein
VFGNMVPNIKMDPFTPILKEGIEMKTIMIPFRNRRCKAKAQIAACSGVSSHENLSSMVNELGLELSTSNPDA